MVGWKKTNVNGARAGAGERYALPTFLTCKFAELEIVNSEFSGCLPGAGAPLGIPEFSPSRGSDLVTSR